MSIRYPLLKILSDMDYHSGNELAQSLQLSRTAIWKSVLKLKELGIEIESRHGKGYRLLRRLDLLDQEQLEGFLQTNEAKVELHAELDSTNSHLLQRLQSEKIHAHVVICEYQSKGRGRRGREWVSPFATGLYMSIGWHFAAPPASLNALSLASGVALMEALQHAGVEQAYLKWPNDVIAQDAKLAGILIESKSETATSCDVVIGIGMNVNLADSDKEKIDQPVSDLLSLTKTPLSRNQIAAYIIDAQFKMLGKVSQHGPNSFIKSWREFDYLNNKKAFINTGNEIIYGVVKGVDDNGLLLMNIDGVDKQFSSGEVSLRAQT